MRAILIILTPAGGGCLGLFIIYCILGICLLFIEFLLNTLAGLITIIVVIGCFFLAYIMENKEAKGGLIVSAIIIFIAGSFIAIQLEERKAMIARRIELETKEAERARAVEKERRKRKEEAARYSMDYTALEEAMGTLSYMPGTPGLLGIQDAKTAMHEAAARGDVQRMVQLEEQGYSVNVTMAYRVGFQTVNTDGWTPMHIAAIHGKMEAIKWLKEQGADINARTDNGRTPLRMVDHGGMGPRTRNRDAIIQWLKENGATYEPSTSGGRMPLGGTMGGGMGTTVAYNIPGPRGQLQLQPRPPIVLPVDPLITFVKEANFLQGLPHKNPALAPVKMRNLTLGEAFDLVPQFSQQHWVTDGRIVTLTFISTRQQDGRRTDIRMSFTPNTARGAASRISGAAIFTNGDRLNETEMKKFFDRMYDVLEDVLK